MMSLRIFDHLKFIYSNENDGLNQLENWVHQQFDEYLMFKICSEDLCPNCFCRLQRINLKFITDVTFNFKMKAVFEICQQGNSVEQKISQMRLDHIKGDILNKPIPKQTLDLFRGIKINRFVVPSETSLSEALQIYYREYQILYQQNKKLNRQFIEVIEEKNQLAQILISKKKLNESLGGKVKRKRRYASQIKRKFHCPIDECGKCYGTEGSLTQHVKIKHLEYFKSGDYEIYLTDIIKDKLCLDTNSI